MLKITPDPTFKTDLKITIPGRQEPETISITFNYHGRDEYLALAEWIRGDEVEEVIDGKTVTKYTGRPIEEAFPKFVAGWDGVDAEFNPENIRIFLNSYPLAFNEIYNAYAKQIIVSRVKN